MVDEERSILPDLLRDFFWRGVLWGLAVGVLASAVILIIAMLVWWVT